MKRYEYTSNSVPVLCTTDCSWPILKVECLNAEKMEEYIARSYKIASGLNQPKVSFHEIIQQENKFTFIKFAMIANAGNLADNFFIARHLFTVLFSKSSSDCSTSKQHLEGMMSVIESGTRLTIINHIRQK